ncbi:MAG: hypothetical protein ACTJFR_02125 [Canibacter sp.]
MFLKNVLQIDPHQAMSWVSPTRLRFGFDALLLEFDDPSPAQQAVLSSLLSGTTRQHLERVAQRVHLSEKELAELLHFLEPLLLHVASPLPRNVSKRTAIESVGRFTNRASQVAQPRVQLVFDSETGPKDRLLETVVEAFDFFHMRAEVAESPVQDHDVPLIIFARYFPSFGFLHTWLTQDRLVVPVLLSDGGVRVGPRLGAPHSCCLDCLITHETHRDTDWPAIVAAQMGSTPPSETPDVIRHIPPMVSWLLQGYAETRPGLQSTDEHTFTQYFLPVVNGQVVAPAETRVIPPQTDCACQDMLRMSTSADSANTSTTSPECDAA